MGEPNVGPWGVWSGDSRLWDVSAVSRWKCTGLRDFAH